MKGSIVGTRKDMQEAIAFAVEGKVKALVHAAKLEDINDVLDDLKKGKIDGRGRNQSPEIRNCTFNT